MSIPSRYLVLCAVLVVYATASNAAGLANTTRGPTDIRIEMNDALLTLETREAGAGPTQLVHQTQFCTQKTTVQTP